MDDMTAATQTTKYELLWASEEAMDSRFKELTTVAPAGNKVLNVMWWVQQNVNNEAIAAQKVAEHLAKGYTLDSNRIENLLEASVESKVAARLDRSMAALHQSAEGEYLAPDEELQAIRDRIISQLVVGQGRSTSAVSNEMNRVEMDTYRHLLSTIEGM
jgi:hypothetical protein